MTRMGKSIRQEWVKIRFLIDLKQILFNFTNNSKNLVPKETSIVNIIILSKIAHKWNTTEVL